MKSEKITTQNGNLANQSTEKAFAVLEFLVSHSEPLRLLDISKQLGMNGSTVSRYLSALENCGYVEQEENTLRYRASTKICELANRLMSTFQLTPLAHPYIQRLSDFFGETSCLVVERNNSVLYIDIVVSASKSLINVQRIGNSAPLYCTAAGKVFLSGYSEERLAEYLKTHDLIRFTESTITDEHQLRKELDLIREQGFAIDNEEIEAGLKCISVPVYDHNDVISACISITGPSSRLTQELLEEKSDYLFETAKALSDKLY